MLVPAIRPAHVGRARRAARAARARCAIALGVHPQVVPELDADELADLRDATRATRRPTRRAIAIGECGLDGAHRRARAAGGDLPRARPRRARARPAAGRPRPARARRGAADPARGGSGRAASCTATRAAPTWCRSIATLGMAFSFAGPVTYANARKPIEAARAVPARAAARRDRRARSGTRAASRRAMRAGIRRSRDRRARRGARGSHRRRSPP